MKNFQKLILFYSILLFIPFVYAQESTPNTSSLLWEISGKKVKQPCYLFGTMHLVPDNAFYFPEELENHLFETDILVLEIGGLQEQMKGMHLMMLDSLNLFDDFFTNQQLDSIFTYSTKVLGWDEEMMRLRFSKMKPFVLMQILLKDQFGESPKSYDLHFETLAKTKEMEVKGLETIEEQLGFINDIPKEKQVEMVMSAIRDAKDSTMQSPTIEMVEIYQTQNIDSIYRFISQSEMNSPQFESTFLIDRNKKWIPSIQKLIRKNKTFIAVGAGHLGGKTGLIQLLREEGYTLTPIKY